LIVNWNCAAPFPFRLSCDKAVGGRQIHLWHERKIEVLAKQALQTVHGTDAIWSKYEHTREDIVNNVLPWVAAREPDLSDHGVDHIANVMDNLGRVLGIDSSGNIQPSSPVEGLAPFQKILLLLGALLHDIGNIRGRVRHNLATLEVWRNSGNSSYERWKQIDRKTIIALCQAHTGRAADGSEDTLKPLAASQHYFLNDPVPLAKLAATLRFADELAEGSQRTSRFMLFQELYGVDSVNFHRYANSTDVIIDRANGRIALNYHIDITEPGFGDGYTVRENLRSLLELIFKRVLKLETERVFARHYAPDWLVFSETSVRLTVSRGHEQVFELQPLVLNDFNLRNSSLTQLTQINKTCDVRSIIEEVFGRSDIVSHANA
jgi:hypothetical protein